MLSGRAQEYILVPSGQGQPLALNLARAISTRRSNERARNTSAQRLADPALMQLLTPCLAARRSVCGRLAFAVPATIGLVDLCDDGEPAAPR